MGMFGGYDEGNKMDIDGGIGADGEAKVDMGGTEARAGGRAGREGLINGKEMQRTGGGGETEIGKLKLERLVASSEDVVDGGLSAIAEQLVKSGAIQDESRRIIVVAGIGEIGDGQGIGKEGAYTAGGVENEGRKVERSGRIGDLKLAGGDCGGEVKERTRGLIDEIGRRGSGGHELGWGTRGRGASKQEGDGVRGGLKDNEEGGIGARRDDISDKVGGGGQERSDRKQRSGRDSGGEGEGGSGFSGGDIRSRSDGTPEQGAFLES
jgi:hypothetical protein